jgi:hypothetical protein
VESDLRAHDYDPRVPVLANRHGRGRPTSGAAFSHFLGSVVPNLA